jgi:CDP-diacylglycerol--glycerol-3-phosphate 3-phosphatidyltransferase
VLDIKARNRVDRIIQPFIRLHEWLHVTPTAVTMVALVLMVVGGVIIGAGHPITGVVIATVGALLDVVDGALARATDSVTARGGLLDTVSDRVAEMAVWTGVAVYVADDQQAVALCVTGLGASLLVSFVRARAEAAGVQGKGGLMGRAERLIVLLGGIFLSGYVDFNIELVTLWVFNVLTWWTVVHRLYRTWAQLGE